MTRRWIVAMALGFGCTALAACSAILGLPDPTIDESIGKPDAGTSQSASSSTASSSSSSSTGGAGGKGGTGGKGGAGGVPDPTPTQLYNAQVRRIALDTARIYWTEELDNNVGAMNKDGSKRVLLASGQPATGFHPNALTFDDAAVYWVSGFNEIRSCSKAGCGNNPTLLLMKDPKWSPEGMGVDASFLYFTNYIDDTHNSIAKMPKTGGNANVTELTPASALCPSINRISLDATAGLIWFTCEDGHVGNIKTSDGSVTIVTPANAPTGANGFVLANGTVYYAQSIDTGSIFSVPAQVNDAGVTTLALKQPNTNGITADGTYLWWLNVGIDFTNAAGTLVRCPISDCQNNQKTLATNQDLPQNVLNDADSVYWAALGNGPSKAAGIWKIKKQ